MRHHDDRTDRRFRAGARAAGCNNDRADRYRARCCADPQPYGIDETVRRLKADIADKGIRFFTEIDQSQLGASADIAIRPSRLILFGNPPLGVQFLSSNPYSGLDWPVRMLILEEADGSVSVAWTEFGYIANRFGIKDRDAQFAMANAVATSIASSVTR